MSASKLILSALITLGVPLLAYACTVADGMGSPATDPTAAIMSCRLDCVEELRIELGSEDDPFSGPLKIEHMTALDRCTKTADGKTECTCTCYAPCNHGSAAHLELRYEDPLVYE